MGTQGGERNSTLYFIGKHWQCWKHRQSTLRCWLTALVELVKQSCTAGIQTPRAPTNVCSQHFRVENTQWRKLIHELWKDPQRVSRVINQELCVRTYFLCWEGRDGTLSERDETWIFCSVSHKPPVECVWSVWWCVCVDVCVCGGGGDGWFKQCLCLCFYSAIFGIETWMWLSQPTRTQG